MKVALSRRFIALSVSIITITMMMMMMRTERSHKSNSKAHLKTLEQKEEITPQISG